MRQLSDDRLSALDHLLQLDAARHRGLNADLNRFRDLIMPRPEAFRRELLGLAEERRSKLAGPEAQALQVLTLDPDLLGLSPGALSDPHPGHPN